MKTNFKIFAEIPDLRGICSAIANGLGYSILPDRLCSEWIAEERLALSNQRIKTSPVSRS
jgi:DNA-binding transcriptional LysR family regulator